MSILSWFPNLRVAKAPVEVPCGSCRSCGEAGALVIRQTAAGMPAGLQHSRELCGQSLCQWQRREFLVLTNLPTVTFSNGDQGGTETAGAVAIR